ncbi:MAG: 3-isopropylmalate dehydratase large subunit [Planctomycetota bacterium]|jgi:3-isopropylmalate/(R)-2-methylmalate dehydratase large subunit
MAMTISQKILADHAGMKEVSPGQLINAKIDIAMGNDITAPITISQFKKSGAKKVFDREKVVFVPDHFAPNKDIKSAEQCKIMKHALLPEQGIVVPGDLVVGADSHTCTYGALGAFSTGVGSTDLAAAIITGELWFKVPETIKLVYKGKLKPWVGGKDLILYTIGKIGVDGALYQAMEFTGETIDALSMDDRLTMANMAVEAGAKNGIFHPDQTTEIYVKSRAKRKYRFFSSDAAAPYRKIIEFDVSKIEPQVSFPHLPSNTKGIHEVGHHSIDQAVIGSCTNGRLSDMRIAAEVLNGHKIASAVRLIIIPATPTIYRMAMKEGLFDIFLDAGAVISPPTCGPCLGGYMGVLAKGEKAIATTNRNFVGRMGHRESEVYLSNPAVAAASAVLGRIASPEELSR